MCALTPRLFNQLVIVGPHFPTHATHVMLPGSAVQRYRCVPSHARCPREALLINTTVSHAPSRGHRVSLHVGLLTPQHTCLLNQLMFTTIHIATKAAHLTSYGIAVLLSHSLLRPEGETVTFFTWNATITSLLLYYIMLSSCVHSRVSALIDVFFW